MSSDPPMPPPAPTVSACEPELPTLPLWLRSQSTVLPRTVGRYRIQGHLGEGGMGVVLVGHDEVLDRRVAVKILRGSADGERSGARMLREAQALARLSHPNIVPVFEAGTDSGLVYIAMELVDGRPLSEVLADGTQPWRRTLEQFVQAGRGLAAAHEAGLVHRDFKPANVMVGADGRVRVLDFGLARAADSAASYPGTGVPEALAGVSDDRITATGALVGTPAYMSPEQRMGESLDARTDQFSFCVALWEALYRVNPRRGRAVLQEHSADVSASDPGVPRRVRRAIERGLALDPAIRWPDMGSLLAALQAPGLRMRTAGALVVLAAALAVGWVANDRDPCSGAAAGVSRLWGAAQRPLVRARIVAADEALGVPTADYVLPALDHHADALAAARSQSCRAHAAGDTPPRRYGAQQACLQAEQARLEAIVAELTDADRGAVLGAVAAVGDLDPPSGCRDPSLHTPQQALAPAAVQMRSELSRLDARLSFGRDVSEPISKVLAQAEAVGVVPLMAEAALLAGRQAQLEARYVEAAGLLTLAYEYAERSGNDRIAAQSSIWLVTVVGARLVRLDAGAVWVQVALAKLSRRPDLVRLRDALAFARGSLAHARGDLPGAQAQYTRALRLRERRLGPQHLAVADALERLGSVARERGEFERARGLHETVARRRTEILGATHPGVLRSRAHLAMVHADLGDLVLARDELGTLAEQLHDGGGAGDVEATVLRDLAGLEDKLGDLDLAAQTYEEAIAVSESANGPEHPHVATIRAALAGLETARAHYDRSAALARRALAAHEATLGPDHPDLVIDLNNLGIAQENLGDLDSARTNLERSLRICRARLGARHACTVSPLVNLATVAVAHEQFGEARARLLEALSIGEEAQGVEHPGLAHTLYHLGLVEGADGHRDQSIAYLERAFALPQLSAEMRAEIGFGCAQAWLDKDRARAGEYAERAIRGFTSAGRPDYAQQIGAWAAREGLQVSVEASVASTPGG